jgi:hypothetical protein
MRAFVTLPAGSSPGTAPLYAFYVRSTNPFYLELTLWISESGIARSSTEYYPMYESYGQARSDHDAKCTLCIPKCHQGATKLGHKWLLECSQLCESRCNKKTIEINERFQTLDIKNPLECKKVPLNLEQLQKLQVQWLKEFEDCKLATFGRWNGRWNPKQCYITYQAKKATLSKSTV